MGGGSELDLRYVGKVRFVLTALVGLAAATATAYANPTSSPVAFHAMDASGKPFDLERLRGRVVALTFASRQTRDEAAHVNQELAGRASSAVTVVSVVDLSNVPTFALGYARRRVAESDHPGRLEHVVDEHGTLARPLQAEPQRRVDMLIIDREGALRGRFVGEKQLAQALHLLDELAADGPAR